MTITLAMIAAGAMLIAALIGHGLGSLKTKGSGLQITGAIILFIVILWMCGGAQLATQVAVLLHR